MTGCVNQSSIGKSRHYADVSFRLLFPAKVLPQCFAESFQSFVKITADRGKRSADQRNDFAEREAAPKVGHDDLALFERQFAQPFGQHATVELVVEPFAAGLTDDKPVGTVLLAVFSVFQVPTFFPQPVNGGISCNTIQPRRRVVRRPTVANKLGQSHKGVVRNIFRSGIVPLARKENERLEVLSNKCGNVDRSHEKCPVGCLFINKTFQGTF